jgi:hypothetical protein
VPEHIQDPPDHIIANPPLIIDLPSSIADSEEEEERCLDEYKGGCSGEVELRMPLSGTGVPFPRCDRHWDERLVEQDRINVTYGPSSDVAPGWIDESYAGERWSDDY